MCEYLTRRAGRYSIRRRVPQDLVAYYGKQEITKALGTADPKEAARLCRLEAVRLDQEWEAARATLAPPSSNRLTAAQLAAHEWGEYEQTLFAAQDAVEQEALEEQYAVASIIEHSGLAGLLAMGGVNLGPLTGLPVTRVSVAQPSHASAQAAKRTLITDVLTLWEREKPRQQRTMNAKRAEIGRYSAMTGIAHVEDVTKASARDFRDKMLAANYTAKNTNKYLDSLRALLNFAVSEDLIPANPANGVKANVTASEDDDRKPFPLDALNTIFSSPVYTEKDRPLGGAGEAAYWLPLLGLFTGARLEELGQLHSDDVHEESTPDRSLTAWVIRITAGEDQRLKTPSSRRRVPVHQTLIDLGFIEYIKAAKTEKRRRIFDKLKPNKYGTHTGAWSQWFSRYLRGTCGIKDDGLVFHSFRHSFKDYCRAVEIAEDVHDAFTGHTNDSVARKYGGTYPLAPLVNAMAKFQVPGLALPSISPTN